MVVHGIVRYVCWPWYDCGCPVGKLVSESVMRRHLKQANEKRARLRRGRFKPGLKVTNRSITEHVFPYIESLEDHGTDDEGDSVTRQIGQSQTEPVRNDFPSSIRTARVLPSDQLHGAEENAGTGQDGVAIAMESTHSATYRNTPTAGSLSIAVDAVDNYAVDMPGFGESYAEILNGATHMPPIEQDPNQTDPELESSNDSAMEQSSVSTSDNGHEDNLNESSNDYVVETSSHPVENGDIAGDLAPSFEIMDDPGEDLTETLDPLAFSRIPTLLSWVERNRKWIDLYTKHGLEFTVMDDILETVEAPCKKWATVMNCIDRSSGIMESLLTIPNCPGHMCYAQLRESDPISHCTVCGRDAPTTDEACDVVKYLPILPRIAAIVRSQQGYNALYGYRHNYCRETGLKRDYFDGHAFQRLCEMYGGEEGLDHDIFLSVSTDGFQAHKNKNYDVWPLVAVLYNLPPEQRTCVKNILPLMFIPDGKEPKDLQSYLTLLVNELLAVAEGGGTLLKFYDGTERRVRIHLIHFTGDSPAIAKVACLKGHHGLCHCRFCLVQGVYCSTARSYYFPSRYKTSSGEMIVVYNPEALPLRTEDSTSQTMLQLENAVTGIEREGVSRATGIKGPSVLFSLPSILPYVSFPIDTMHLFYNIQTRLLEQFTSIEVEPYALGKLNLDKLDDELTTWGLSLSGQLCPRPKPLSHFRRWKAAEHRHFTLQYCLVLFDGYLPQEFLFGLQHFVELVDICCQTSVTDSQVEQCGVLALKFFCYYERSFMRYDRRRIGYAKSVFHQILHLKDCLIEVGPLPYCAQNWVEGYIGWISDRNNA